MNRGISVNPKPVIMVSLIIVLALGGLGAAAWLGLTWLMRGPLQGQTQHAFEPVWLLMGQPVLLEHTFELRNRSSQPITIRQVKPDCGCVSTSLATPVTVEPGRSVQIPVRYRLSNAGRSVPIFLDLGPDGIQTLRVSATGLLRPRLSATVVQARLNRAGRSELYLVAEMWGTYDAPEPPIVSVPPGLKASVGSWRLKEESRTPDLKPNLWQAPVMIEQVGEAPAGDVSVRFQINRAEAVDVKVIAPEPS